MAEHRTPPAQSPIIGVDRPSHPSQYPGNQLLPPFTPMR
jgi:hypothetical protein